MRRTNRFFLGAAALLLPLPSLAVVEVPEDLADRIRANQRGLVEYAWTMRIDIEHAGRSLGSTEERLRFGDQGYVDRDLVEDSRTRAARKKNMEALVERLVSAVVPYLAPAPDGAASFLAEAEVQEEDGKLRFRGTGFLDPGDTVDLIVEREPLRAVTMAILTGLDEAPVKIRAEYEALADGPNHVARVTVDYPAEDVRLTIENTDYEKVR